MKRSKPLYGRGASALTPLPPAPPSLQVVPDIRIESALYAALQFEREKNKALTKQVWDSEAKFQRFRANALVYRTAKGLVKK